MTKICFVFVYKLQTVKRTLSDWAEVEEEAVSPILELFKLLSDDSEVGVYFLSWALGDYSIIWNVVVQQHQTLILKNWSRF